MQCNKPLSSFNHPTNHSVVKRKTEKTNKGLPSKPNSLLPLLGKAPGLFSLSPIR